MLRNFETVWGRKAAALGAAVVLVGLAACGEGLEPAPAPATDAAEQALGEVRLRLMAANITSGTQQSYDPGHGIRIFQGTDPDVAMLQEFNYGDNSPAALRAFVDEAFGTTFHYCREAGAQIPNGVVSRYPILGCGEWDDPRVTNRDFAWARIDMPGAKDLWAVSVHLLTASSTERNLEAQSLVQFIQANVPAGDYLVIAGDLNTDSRTEPCFSTLASVVSTSGAFPVDRNGNGHTNASRAKPYDHVLVDGDLVALQTAVVLGSSSYASGLVVDTRVHSPLSELSPALAGDSGAEAMQHMGVLKDFLLPDGTTPAPTLSVTAPNGGESYAAGTSQTVRWAASGLSSVRVELSTNGGSTWTVLSSGTSASTGSLAWTVPSTATTAARVRVSDAAGSGLADTSDAAFTLTTSAPAPAALFLNEILANEPGSDAAGEFVELVNAGSTAADLGGWTLSDATGVRHTFPAGTSLAAGRALVVFGASTAIPAGHTNASAASTGTLGLSNSGDTVTLRNAAGTSVAAYTYASGLAGTDGVSMNRSPDGSAGGSFVLHTAVTSRTSSPGKRADGTDFGGSAGGGGSTGAITAESEDNGTAATADGRVGNGVAVAGALASSTDVDWFSLRTSAGGSVTVSLAIDGAADLDWYVYASGNTTSYLARGYTTSNPERATFTASGAGTYLVKVVGYSGATGTYRLTVSSAAGVVDP